MSRAASVMSAMGETKSGTRRPSGYGAVEAILHEHTRDIARVESDLGQLGSAVGELKATNVAILGKLDQLATELAKAPRVPQLRDVATSAVGVVVGLTAFVGSLMWLNSVVFSQLAKPIESAIALTKVEESYELRAVKDRLAMLESAVQFKPSFREWTGR
jgi:hypothetical protein